jgi:VWFA-related protein
LLGFLALCALAAEAQAAPPRKNAPPPFNLSVTSALVVLPVTVTANGHFVSGLRARDFQVYEDGQPQTVTVFDTGDAPVTVGLIVDHSGSMADKLPEVAAASRAFAQSSNPRDEMFVVDFNERAAVESIGGSAFSNDPQKLEGALTAVSAGGETALYDAVAVGLRYLRFGGWQRKALIVVSDGGDNASRLRFSQVLALAQQSQAAIYAIGLESTADDEGNPGLLKQLCKATGGMAYFPEAGNSVMEASAAIARDLRAQYTLGYVPHARSDKKTFRKVVVKVAASGRGKLTARTPPGYSTGPDY